MRCYTSILLLLALSKATISEEIFGMKLTTEGTNAKDNIQYRFHYFVKDDVTGDYKAQEEIKEGDSVQGSYTIADPNGDLRKVTYKAGPGKGFEAKVDVHPSGSPVKATTERITMTSPTTFQDSKTLTSVLNDRRTTLKSNLKHFPGGFLMSVLRKPKPEVKAEMGVKFSIMPITAPITESSVTVTPQERKTTETLQSSSETITTQTTELNRVESSTENFSKKDDVSEDPIAKEIDEVEKSMPKLPELVLSDNKTHFKFHKDPEEALLEDRISQIARQLAETSLRREYEERKLGHFIPISVSPIELSDYFSKSIKFTQSDFPSFTSPEPSLHIMAPVKLVPDYIYKQTLPTISSTSYRLPIVTQNQPQMFSEMITKSPDIPKPSKTDDVKYINDDFIENSQEYSTTYQPSDSHQISIMPASTFFKFFSPYVMNTPRNPITPNRLQSELFSRTTKNDLTTRQFPKKFNITPFSYLPMTITQQNN